MFKVKICHSVWKKTPIKVGRSLIKVGYEIEQEIDLPFFPFVGLAIDLPTTGDPIRCVIETVTWDVAVQECWCSSQDATSEYESSQEMADEADWLEREGFKIYRGNIAPDRW
jgi:hypothetical protein